MTKEEARKILENSKRLKPFQTSGENFMRYKCVGDLNKEYKNGFGFAVYPYNHKEPIDPTLAFEYFVDKETGEVTSASAPMSDWELEGLNPPKIGERA